MKILKGIGIYTLLILGALLVFAMLIVGCMFMFPNFDVFGWKVMFKSNVSALNYNSGALSSEATYTINIDAGVHNVNVYQFTDETSYINIEKVDDMFGFYKGEYNEKLVFAGDSQSIHYVDANGNQYVNITLGNIDGAVLGRSSKLNVYLPNITNYNLNIKTTTGNVYIDGTGVKGTTTVHDLNLAGLSVETTSGDFSWANINTQIVKVSDKTDETKYFTATKVDEIKTDEEGFDKNNYARFLLLETLSAKTKTGEFDFTLSNADCGATYIASSKVGSLNFYDTITNGSKPSDILTQLDKNDNGFYLSAERGDFEFSNVIASKLSIIGTDVLVKANSIQTWNDFYFNVPNGYFEIENLDGYFKVEKSDESTRKTLNTIITNNINIDLETVGGELSITTTYGSINLGTLKENASLTSTDGNINVKVAESSISAISEKGDITIEKYQGKGYLKNKSGKIKASFDIDWYKQEKASLEASDYLQELEVYNETASTEINNAVFATNIKSGSGNLNVSYYEMPTVGSIKHTVVVTGGKANIKVSNLEAFLFLGKGSISGTVGSVDMKQTEGTDPVVLLTPSVDSSLLTELNVSTSSNGSITFATYLINA